MSLSQGRPYLAIPGPSVVPDRVLQAMHRPAPNIYTGALVDMVDTLLPDLKTIAGTGGEAAIYIANGHGVWEASLANVLSPGDRVLVLNTGNFGRGWGEVAAGLGAEVQQIDFDLSGPVDPARVESALRDDKDRKIKAVLVVHVDTATGVRNDIATLRAAMDAAGHPALLMVDCIASLACDRFAMDDWGVDVMVAGSQKGLMTPPGIGFVFFNDKAKAARAGAGCVTRYWDWAPRVAPEQFYQRFYGTAPTHHLYGLREALTMILREEGLSHVLARHATLARAIWAAFDTWGQAGGVEVFLPDPAHRSHAVTAFRTGVPADGTRLRDWMEREAGVTLGIGLGLAAPQSPEWHRYFRIGHMGHVNAHMVLGVLACVQAGLVALEIPHAPGGLDAAAQVCAGAR
ncbi:MAG: alanine--glyoxylate aminotransferase family protein [Rhodobacteraceae bacterium]|nr:alanine--glyoxylate aminotransferase family protein [Paracoccaceae bacterium]